MRTTHHPPLGSERERSFSEQVKCPSRKILMSTQTFHLGNGLVWNKFTRKSLVPLSWAVLYGAGLSTDLFLFLLYKNWAKVASFDAVSPRLHMVVDRLSDVVW